MLSSAEIAARRHRHARWSEQAQQLFEQNPARYWTGLALLIAAGYLLLTLTVMTPLLVLVAVVAALIFKPILFLLLKKAIIFLFALIYWLFKSLWVKAEIPQGYLLNEQQCPALFAELQALRKSLRVPTIHQVLLDGSYNAGVIQTPRLGLLGWYHNTLVLGLPLLLTVDTAQARAVLAHELGHLSRNHGAFGNWVYRLRLRWWRVLMVLDNASESGARGLAQTIERFVSYFSAYTLVYARRCEFEADAVAAELTSKPVAASALVATHVSASWLDDAFWQPTYRRADHEAEPVADIYQQLRAFTQQQSVPAADVERYLAALQRRQVEAFDSHPPTRERVAALEQIPQWQPPTQQAAERWLGPALDTVLNDFSRQWRQYHAEGWQSHHQSLQADRERYQAIRTMDDHALSKDEQWDLARLTERFQPDADALVLYQRFHDQYPDDLTGQFVLGQRLLAKNDGRGVEYLTKAYEEFALREAVCACLVDYFIGQADSEQTERWERRAREHHDALRSAQAERATLLKTDSFESANLDAEALQQLHYSLLQTAAIKRAWVARKIVRHPGPPVHVIAIEVGGFFTSNGKVQAAMQAAAHGMRNSMPVLVVATQGGTAELGRKIKLVGQAIYPA
ncbi:M48 family metalloprotease [Permianibacter sp. IMCC34836]|uniref:M48 family metalloprotease n=1 Tax=Permianibacter fluminis TaxID=2738515 RepID=UPI0015528255|nr:M48 family metallopeptidase [Permianibacter fluminis]NQD39077.1 M48 family metalloprotease [Permianibacter fluminis]